MSLLDVAPIIEQMLLVSENVSDLNFSCGQKPQVEVNGVLYPASPIGLGKLSAFQTEMIAMSLIRSGEIDINNIRFFIGYSGWSSGQLNDELKEKSWLTAQATRKLIFHKVIDEIWKDALCHLGGDYEMMINFPIDPRLN